MGYYGGVGGDGEGWAEVWRTRAVGGGVVCEFWYSANGVLNAKRLWR